MFKLFRPRDIMITTGYEPQLEGRLFQKSLMYKIVHIRDNYRVIINLY